MMLWEKRLIKLQNSLGIEFPGGPKLEKFAQKGNPNKFNLPKPIINKGGAIYLLLVQALLF